MKKNLILLFLSALFMAGCGTDYEILKSAEAIILTTDSSVKKIGEPITFTVKDKAGTDLTAESVFYVNGQQVEGNTYTSATVGNFELTAKYFSVTSDPVIISFHDGTGLNFRKNMLVEDYTGTWCGYCPRVAWGIELLHGLTQDAVAVAIHRPSSNPGSLVYDPYNYQPAEVLEEFLGGNGGYPKGFLNRTILWTNPEPDNLDEAVALTQGLNPKLGLAMTAAVANNTITMDVDVMFGQNFSNLKLVVYVLENGLIYDQHNYTSYYNDEDILHNFVHNHVLRECLTPIMGEAIDGTQSVMDNTYTRSFNVAVPASIANSDNIEFVAFVVDATGTVVNVRKAKPGETQEMQLL